MKITEKLSVQYSGDLIRFTPDEENLSTFINVGSLNYNFTKDLWIRVFAQNSSRISKVYFYGMTGWRFIPPFGAVYLVYSHDQEAEIMGDPTQAAIARKASRSTTGSRDAVRASANVT